MPRENHEYRANLYAKAVYDERTGAVSSRPARATSRDESTSEVYRGKKGKGPDKDGGAMARVRPPKKPKGPKSYPGTRTPEKASNG